ncbi:hypothetical protein [Streptomyces nigra]|uniref:hypothetical protein n=1 Tax=Streptomyces nigra TaxID=1827580 RepID=UPI003659621A
MPLRRRPDPNQGSGISIGGNNTAPIQNVVGQNISHTHQTSHLPPPTVTPETLQALLTTFRTTLTENEARLPHATALQALTDDIERTLTTPTPDSPRALQSALQALPALVTGTAVQQSGEALAQALVGWLG